MPGLPVGTLTFLFTDIEGSTRLLAAAVRRRAQVGGGTPNFVVDNNQMTAEARAALSDEGRSVEADRAWAEGETLDDDALAALIG